MNIFPKRGAGVACSVYKFVAGWTVFFSKLDRERRISSSSKTVQISSETHPKYYPMGTIAGACNNL
jgi:hypothetical protein